MRFSIEQKVLEKLLSFVATKPYSEVAKIIQEVQNDIKQIEEPVTPKEVPHNKVRAFPQVEPPTEIVE